MRIAFIPLSYLPNVGGAEFVLHNSLIEHRRAGHKVAVFPNLGSVAVVTHLPYRCVPVWRRAWSNTIAAGEGPGHRALPRRWLRWRLRAIQRWFKADVWHIHSVYPVSWAVIDVLRDELKVPVVITSHGGDVANYAELLGAEPDHQFEARVRATLAAADELIAVGPNVVKSYLEAGAPGDRIWVIPHGWHPQRVEQAERNLSTTKAALSLTGRLVALTVAADRPEKRLDDVLEASLLLDSDSSWSWIIATSSNRLSTEVNQSGLSDRVVVREEPPFSRTDFGHGLPRQEILDLYAVADVMVLPSLFEASPTVIHEAFTSGTPVIATVAAAAGLVRDGVDGLLVASERPEELAAALRSLERDPTLLERLSAGAATRGQSIDDWSAVAARHREVYESAIARRIASPTANTSGTT